MIKFLASKPHVLLTRLEDENPQWVKIFQDLPEWRVFLIKDGNILPSRHLEREVVFLEEIVNDSEYDRDLNNNLRKRKRENLDPFKVFISPDTRKAQRLGRKRKRPTNLRQFNGTENLFVERRLEDFTSEWVKEKSRLGRLNYKKRQKISRKENGSESSFSSSTATTPENDENIDPNKNIVDIEEEYRLKISMGEISRFKKQQHIQHQRILVSRALVNLNAMENKMKIVSSNSSIENLVSSMFEDYIIKDQGNEFSDRLYPFDDSNDDYSIYTDFDLLLFDPVEDKGVLDLLLDCFDDIFT